MIENVLNISTNSILTMEPSFSSNNRAGGLMLQAGESTSLGPAIPSPES